MMADGLAGLVKTGLFVAAAAPFLLTDGAFAEGVVSTELVASVEVIGGVGDGVSGCPVAPIVPLGSTGRG
jgi:hypothetical protein